MQFLSNDELSQRAKNCPYFGIPCQDVCPAWLAPMDDCLFHVCLTQVKETFVAAALYLDRHLGLADGFGMQTINGLRQVITGEATDEQKEVVRSVITSMISTGVLQKIEDLTAEKLAGLIGKVEDKISFAFSKLWGREETEDPGYGDENTQDLQ